MPSIYGNAPAEKENYSNRLSKMANQPAGWWTSEGEKFELHPHSY
jgi:hypothetical protein